jgi:large subunit ribosomal protein L10
MPKTKAQKEALVDEIAATLEAKRIVYLTNYSGLTVSQADSLRNLFRQSGVTYRVYKNTLIRLAMQKVGGFDDLLDHLNGPTAVAFSDEPAAPARVIKKFVSDRAVELPELKAAFIDGAFYGAETIDVLAALKSKDEIIGDVVGLLLSPIRNVLGALQAPGQTIAGSLQTIAEREAA